MRSRSAGSVNEAPGVAGGPIIRRALYLRWREAALRRHAAYRAPRRAPRKDAVLEDTVRPDLDPSLVPEHGRDPLESLRRHQGEHPDGIDEAELTGLSHIVAEHPSPGTGRAVMALSIRNPAIASWHGGTGATDNAAESAVMMEAVRILKALNLPMRRTVRIRLWTGEEQGLLGSRAYVRLEFGTREAPTAAVFEAWMKPFADKGMKTLTISNTGWSTAPAPATPAPTPGSGSRPTT